MVRRLAVTSALASLFTLAACGTSAPKPTGWRELVMAHDDGRASATVAFPTSAYETMMRFELPAGEHRPLRLRLQAGAAGRLQVTVYDSTILETPGEVLHRFVRDLEREDLSDGADGRWVVEELADAPPLKGTIWIGVRKTAGEPKLWASAAGAGQAFVRNNEHGTALLPVKRTPMIRLELAP